MDFFGSVVDPAASVELKKLSLSQTKKTWGLNNLAVHTPLT